VELAQEIQLQISVKVHMPKIDDSRHLATIEISSDDESEPVPKRIKTKNNSVAAQALQVPPPSRYRLQSRKETQKQTSQQLLRNISDSLDPSAIAARADERSFRNLQSAQVFALTNQVNDLTAKNEALRDRILECERMQIKAESQVDRYKGKVESLHDQLELIKTVCGMNKRRRYEDSSSPSASESSEV
jgi:hypothetical protein